MPMVLKVVDLNGREVSMTLSAIVSIDGKPYGQQQDPGLSNRITILEAQIADLIQFKDALLSAKPEGTS